MEKTILERKFFLPKKLIKKSYFERNGYRYSKIFSDSDSDVYAYRFIAWRYGSAATLEGEIRVNSVTGQVQLGCYDYGTRNMYASWYCRNYGINDVVSGIDDKFIEEMNKLGIKEK